ncbi:MAG: helix-turn-helix transcriptional regulator [Anaerocolumna sp.]
MYFEQLKNLRTDFDKTQQEIADLLNCKREVYRRYEKGEREIPVWALIKLAQYYNVTLDYLSGLTSKKEKFPTK